MNVKQIKEAINELDLSARYRDGEWRINYRAPHGTEATAYYTQDNDDALATAKAMAARKA